MRIEAPIDVAVEVIWAMEPWSRANEDAARIPLRAVITVGCAFVGRNIVVAVRTSRLNSNVDAYPGLRFGSGYRETNQGNRDERKSLKTFHSNTSSSSGRSSIYVRLSP
jgi:hypothetical protein